MKTSRTAVRVLLAAVLLASGLPASRAQAPSAGYPNQQIRIICPFPGGGGTDLTARLLGEHLNKSLGQPVVIENRTGASGIGRGWRHAQLLIFVLELIEPVINAAQRQQFLMRALLAQLALMEDEDSIGVLDRAQAMGDDDGGAPFDQTIKRLADQQLGLGVHA